MERALRWTTFAWLANRSSHVGKRERRLVPVRGCDKEGDAEIMEFLGGPTARTALLEIAAKRTSAIRTDIAAALGEAGGPEVVPVLVERARSANPNVAIRALSSLGRVRGRSAVPARIALLKAPIPIP